MHSHIFTKSPFQPHAVDVLVLSTYSSLFLHVCRVKWGDARWKRCFACSALHVLLPGVSGDNKKWTRREIFSFSLRWITLPLCFQQEAVRLCEGSVGWIGKVNVFFFPVPTLQTLFSPSYRHSSTWREWDCCCFPSPPLTLRVASFPGLDWIVWNPQFQM